MSDNTMRNTYVRTIGCLLLTAFFALSGFGKSNRPRPTDDQFICGTGADREIGALARGWYNESRMSRSAGKPGTRAALAAAPADVGDVAIIEDDGTLLIEPNDFDLDNKSVRFRPAGNGAYQVTSATTPFNASGGRGLSLGDDDSAILQLGFTFSFYGKDYSSVFLNSDGNLTFLQSDTSTSDRDLGRFLSGPPRIGPLFTDLDPSSGGVVSVRNDSDGVVFIWDRVPEYSQAGGFGSNSFSIKLFQDGNIEFVYGAVDTTEAVAGISPGSALNTVQAIDMSAPPGDSLSGSITEVFTTQSFLDDLAVARRFFQSHADAFDHLNLFLGFDFDLGGGAFAYELPVRNEVSGIGLGLEDNSSFFGSRGRLRSFLNMGSLDSGALGGRRYPSDPNQVFLFTNTTMGIMGQESGHRWLAFTPFRDPATNATSKTILGRDSAHWSFFFDSDGSVMEGNDIQDNGSGLGDRRFVTVGATYRYSLLDQYIMGLVGKDAVPGMFLVDLPTGTLKRPFSPPALGVEFGGQRKDFTIDDIIAANGVRVPAVSAAPKVFRQAFILLTRRGQTATPQQIQKVQNIRDAWVNFFNQATDGRGWVVTDLQNTPGTTPARILFPFFQGNSGRYTGIAVANWGSTPTDVLFTAHDNNGNLLNSPSNIVNPRMITIAPGAQVALLAEQIHGLSLNDARNGWIQADSSSSQISGFFLDGDIAQTFLDGAVAGTQTYTTLYFTRSQVGSASLPGNTYKNLINVINPNSGSAQLSFSLMDENGRVQATATRTLNGQGRIAEDITALFPAFAQPRTTGYVLLTSNVGVVGYQSIDALTTIYSLPAQPPSTANTLYSAQFASGGAGGIQYFTDLNFLNTSGQTRTLQVQLIANNGSPAKDPVTVRLEPGQELRTRGETFFSLPDPAGASLLEGSLVVTSDGPGVIGDVTFGDASRGKFMASLPFDANPVSNLVLAQVAQGSGGGPKPYFTGVAMYNPNANDITATVDVYSEQGEKTGSATVVLPKGGRISKVLPELVSSLNEQLRGYIRLTFSGPAVVFELFGTQSLDFLTAVPPQPIVP